MFDNIGKTDREQPLNTVDNTCEENYAWGDQNVDPNHPLRNIYQTHSRPPVQPFCNYTLNSSHGPVAVYFSSRVNPAGVDHATAVHQVDVKKVLADCCCMIILNGRRRRRLVEMLRNEDHFFAGCRDLFYATPA